MQERVYRTPVHNSHDLKQWLIETWANLQHSITDEAADQCPAWLCGRVNTKCPSLTIGPFQICPINGFFSEPHSFDKKTVIISWVWPFIQDNLAEMIPERFLGIRASVVIKLIEKNYDIHTTRVSTHVCTILSVNSPQDSPAPMLSGKMGKERRQALLMMVGNWTPATRMVLFRWRFNQMPSCQLIYITSARISTIIPTIFMPDALPATTLPIYPCLGQEALSYSTLKHYTHHCLWWWEHNKY